MTLGLSGSSREPPLSYVNEPFVLLQVAAAQQTPDIGLQRHGTVAAAPTTLTYHKNQQAVSAMTPHMIVSASDTDGGGGAESVAAHQRKRAKGDDSAAAAARSYAHAAATEAEKLQHNRERNREHAKNTRLRKKAYMERLKASVDDLCRERDALLSERGASAALLAETHARRVDALRGLFALRAGYEPAGGRDRGAWAEVLDESSFTCRMPVTPYQSFPSSEVQVSNCQRTVCGVDGMIADAAANYVFLNSMVDRARHPDGRMKFQYTLVTEDAPSGGCGGSNQMMARWGMSTLNAKKIGASGAHSSELSQRGMLLCKFNSAHKIVSLEIMFDVMAFMLQVKMAMGFDNFNDVVIPNTVQTCVGQGRQYDYPMVMTLANRPYTIVQVNERWENLTGYTGAEVVGKKSCSILQRHERQRREDSDELDRLMGPMLFQRPSCAMLTNYTKSGRRFRQYVTIYPLSTDSNISHYFGLTTFVQWMDAADGPAEGNVKTNNTVAVDIKSKEADVAAEKTSDSSNKPKAVEFSVPPTTKNNPTKEALATSLAPTPPGIITQDDSSVEKLIPPRAKGPPHN